MKERDMTEQERLAFWTNALNLPGFRVVHERRDGPNDPVSFTVVPADQGHRSRRTVAQKKHRQFVAVIIDHTNRRVLDVLESREKEFVIKYLHEKVESGLLAGVEEVTCDMWEGYVTAAQEAFGKGIR